MVSKKVSFLILGRTRRKRRRKLSLLEARISNEAFEWRRKETKNKKDGGRKGNGQQLDRYGHPTQKKRDRQTERERMSISLFSHFAKAKWWAILGIATQNMSQNVHNFGANIVRFFRTSNSNKMQVYRTIFLSIKVAFF